LAYIQSDNPFPGPISDALHKVKQRSFIGAPGGFGFMNYVSSDPNDPPTSR